MTTSITYKTSGVDIDKANQFVDNIGTHVKSTFVKGVMTRKGSFGALFGLDTKKYKEPVMVSSTDGVGTKLLIAKALNKHDTVGIDLVAMNVNDILCVGAKPLFFLDYIACGKVDVKILTDVVKGIADGCRQSGCALIGGETAEMPGMYAADDYDLAGFTVGVVEKAKIVDGSKIKAGDVLFGLPSTGAHSNGYSMVRKVLSLSDMKKMRDAVLAPTKIYAKEVEAACAKFNVKGMAHITGGAYYEKLPRILPKGLCAKVNTSSWDVPELFKMIQKKGNVAKSEMYRTFNMGIGYVFVIAKKDAEQFGKFLKAKKIVYHIIGEVIKDSKQRVILE
ncbi:MAG: phosphoribosylformylglycinamidine cyclo-ligase [Candidatus Omnitrophica bacterium]|nr:phosphoribosylformylglycinamidine cyclo-ligase [Candidatus Omnitrophota bacterium]